MSERIKTDVCVIGAGSGGLSVAAGAVQMGADVVLVEKGKMGGDCLNYGCVPSKSLLKAGHVAQTFRDSQKFGIRSASPQIDGKKVHDHVHGVIGAIAPHDSQERFEDLGVTVIRAKAEFTGKLEITAGDKRIQARRFVIATGSSAMVPPIEGLDKTPYLTNETVFDLKALPEHLIIVGGGPIGLEMAQAHRRLGCKVTVLEMDKILPKDDPDLVEIVRNRVAGEGVDILEHVEVKKTEKKNKGVAVHYKTGNATKSVEGSHLLIATGRAPNVNGLNLEAAGVAFSRRGIEVDARLRTSNRKIFAIGDVTGGYQFTHMAGYDAGIVIRNALFRLPAKVDHSAVPWVTYTDPELAQVGLNQTQAEEKGEDVRVLQWSFEENDRAQAERDTDGKIKVVVGKKGRILGCGIAAPHAGELLLPWVLAVQEGLKVGTMAGMIAPYPTLGEASKRVAGSYYTEKLFSPMTKRVVRFLRIFG